MYFFISLIHSSYTFMRRNYDYAHFTEEEIKAKALSKFLKYHGWKLLKKVQVRL